MDSCRLHAPRGPRNAPQIPGWVAAINVIKMIPLILTCNGLCVSGRVLTKRRQIAAEQK